MRYQWTRHGGITKAARCQQHTPCLSVKMKPKPRQAYSTVTDQRWPGSGAGDSLQRAQGTPGGRGHVLSRQVYPSARVHAGCFQMYATVSPRARPRGEDKRGKGRRASTERPRRPCSCSSGDGTDHEPHRIESRTRTSALHVA